MRRNILIANFVLLAVSVLFVLIKLFTVEIWFPDDPTVELMLRSKPSLVSRLIITDAQDYPDGHKRILTDENGFVGETAYHFIVEKGWIAAPVLWILFTGICVYKWKSDQFVTNSGGIK